MSFQHRDLWLPVLFMLKKEYCSVLDISNVFGKNFGQKFRTKISNKSFQPDEMSSNEEQIIFEPQAKRISIKGLIYLALKERVRETKRESACMSVCACVCVRACACVCVSVRVSVSACERERVSASG